jgi:methionyl-tRNA formyltransferase
LAFSKGKEKPMRIIFFTNKSARGVEILKQINERNIHLDAIFIDKDRRSLKGRLSKVKLTHKRMGFSETLKYIQKKLPKGLRINARSEYKRNNFYFPYADKVHFVSSFNEKRVEMLLKEYNPDIVVLGGSRIICKNIIDIPTIGILNAHPGLLPKYRGVDVIPWAVYHGDPVGVTIHFIDEGVDTGVIVAQKPIQLTQGDTLGKLMRKANILAGELMAESVRRIVDEDEIQQVPQAKENGMQFYRMPLVLRRETESKLKEMVKEALPKNFDG